MQRKQTCLGSTWESSRFLRDATGSDTSVHSGKQKEVMGCPSWCLRTEVSLFAMMWTQKPALNTRDRSQPESEKNDPSQLEGIRLLGGGGIEVEEDTTSKTLKSRLCVLDFVTYVLILTTNPERSSSSFPLGKPEKVPNGMRQFHISFALVW